MRSDHERGARMAKREEGAYPSVCGRRETPPAAMARPRGSAGCCDRSPRPRGVLGEFLRFLVREKKWWLIPLILLLLGLVGLVVLTEGSALAPFIYPLF
jgi:hypothetical protein